MTTAPRQSSRKIAAAVALTLAATPMTGVSETPVNSLGVKDIGVFSDLDGEVGLELPGWVRAEEVRAVVDGDRGLLVLYAGDWPVKVYPTGGDRTLALGPRAIALRAADRAELAPLLTADRVTDLPRGAAPAPGDRDGDGIPDPLDLLIGGHKAAKNGASYGAGYIVLDYPGGDVPREVGVCTDVIVRAARNAGLDLQVEIHRDIARSPRSYPMVKKKGGNKNIDHRRVKTSLPYFVRHWDRRADALDDPDDPLRPGDVVFMDTFPNRKGPDHVGIVSDRLGASGYPLIINNWTYGSRTTEMDLLAWVPVTHRFRFPSSGR